MKTRISLLFISIFFLFQTQVQAQKDNSDCKVLLENIADNYIGKCKKGLANGEGVAKGIDIYSGEFKNGLPHGDGKYTWANGNSYNGEWKNGQKHGDGAMFLMEENKTTRGIWKNDEFVKEQTNPFKVHRKSSVNYVRAKKSVTHPNGTVEIKFNIPATMNYFNSLEVKSSSGLVVKSPDIVAVSEAKFPLKVDISYEISGKSFVIHKRCMVEFEIFEEGAWLVTID